MSQPPYPPYPQQPGQPPAAQPGDGQSPYGQQVYGQPVYGQPVYGLPVVAQPVDAQPVYPQPVYAQPVYAQPVYAQPVYAVAPVAFKDTGTAYALLLLSFLGISGVQHFYLGKVGRGILWLLTAGLFGIGTLVDLCTLPSQTRAVNAQIATGFR